VLDKLLIFMAETEKNVPMSALTVILGAPPADILCWGDWLAGHGLLKVHRPVGREPFFKSVKGTKKPVTADKPLKGKMCECYPLISDGITAAATILAEQGDTPGHYILRVPAIGKATVLLFEEVTQEFVAQSPLPEVPRDSGDYEEERRKLVLTLKGMFLNKVSKLSEQELDMLSGLVLHRVRGLLDLELYLSDDWIEELGINGHKNPMAIYHRKYGWLLTDRTFKSEEEIYTLTQAVSRQAGTELTTRHPVVDAHLATGDRSIATLFPISAHGDTLTIRRFSRNPWTMLHFLSENMKTLSVEVAAFLWQAMHYELNVLVAGGTASGKTSVLNALCAFIPPRQRTISIEDTREISLPGSHNWNWVPLAVRQPNPEGEGEVSMLELMQSALRMRPDRMIIGEVRKRDQVLTMFEAMNTGHAVCGTIHADTADQVARRILEPPLNVPATEAQALHLVLVQHRDRRTGLRRTTELVEVMTTSSDDLKLNYLYRWLPRKDTFEKVNESMRFVEELNVHTGMTTQEMAADLKEKETVLEWMLSSGITNISAVGEIVARYYQDREALLEDVKKGPAVRPVSPEPAKHTKPVVKSEKPVKKAKKSKRRKKKKASQEEERYRAMHDSITATRILINQKEKKAYTLYLKIQQEYLKLPQKIQMRVSKEYDDLRADINKSIPELKILKKLEKKAKKKSTKDLEKLFFTILDKTEEALTHGEKVHAYILYSEIKKMYHLVPKGIKEEVYRRCVSIHERCVGGSD